ncbi:MAG: LysE family translocator [Pseudomonadota bacterium]|uniref:LysE family translocator n=1 Tax=Sphingomonas sp. ERG5 TaxID=1381597 RepID=UPI0009DEF6CD|nr:LysE family translocator [Sphingomonas sp. ERG5]
MADHSLLAWTLLSIGLVLTPGPDMMIVAGQSARGGVRAGLATMAGIALGGLWYMALCGFGFLSVLTAFPALFMAVKIAGAVYLAWLGIRMLTGAFKPAPIAATAIAPAMGKPFRQGFLSTALNPKVALFFLAILPQFVGTGPDAPVRGMLLIAVPYVLGSIWLTGVTLVAARAGRAVKQSSVMRWFEGVIGAAFLGLAGRLALARNA